VRVARRAGRAQATPKTSNPEVGHEGRRRIARTIGAPARRKANAGHMFAIAANRQTGQR
jgi:hypothetical protein